MLHILTELPEGVELSQHLTENTPFYIGVQLLGITYYIPATPDIRNWLELDKQGHDSKRDRRRRWTSYEKADALRDIVAAVSLQVRDVELAGVEDSVTDRLLDEMRGLMRRRIRTEIGAQQIGAQQKLLTMPITTATSESVGTPTSPAKEENGKDKTAGL